MLASIVESGGAEKGPPKLLLFYTFNGESTFGDFGLNVSGAGDVNGDGVDDFIAGGTNNSRLFVSQISVPFILGDVNQDGVVEFADIPSFIALLIAEEFQAEADCNEDGEVTFADIPAFIEILIAAA